MKMIINSKSLFLLHGEKLNQSYRLCSMCIGCGTWNNNISPFANYHQKTSTGLTRF